MVGTTGFEPVTTTPPVWCATRLRYAPKWIEKIEDPVPPYNDLITSSSSLIRVLISPSHLWCSDLIWAVGHFLPSTADRVALLIKQAFDLPYQYDVLSLIVSSVASPLNSLS